MQVQHRCMSLFCCLKEVLYNAVNSLLLTYLFLLTIYGYQWFFFNMDFFLNAGVKLGDPAGSQLSYLSFQIRHL